MTKIIRRGNRRLIYIPFWLTKVNGWEGKVVGLLISGKNLVHAEAQGTQRIFDILEFAPILLCVSFCLSVFVAKKQCISGYILFHTEAQGIQRMFDMYKLAPIFLSAPSCLSVFVAKNQYISGNSFFTQRRRARREFNSFLLHHFLS